VVKRKVKGYYGIARYLDFVNNTKRLIKSELNVEEVGILTNTLLLLLFLEYWSLWKPP